MLILGGPTRGSGYLGNVRGIGSNAKIVTKRRESVGPWHDSQTKDKVSWKDSYILAYACVFISIPKLMIHQIRMKLVLKSCYP